MVDDEKCDLCEYMSKNEWERGRFCDDYRLPCELAVKHCLLTKEELQLLLEDY